MAQYVSPNLARDYTLAVSQNGNTYVTVSGIMNMKVTTSKKTTDITTFETLGVNVNLPVSFDGKMDLELVETYNTSSQPYVQDVGQTLLLAADSELGVASRIYWKITHRNPMLISGEINGTGFVAMDESGGGGNDDVDKMKGSINFDSRPTGIGAFANKMGSQ